MRSVADAEGDRVKFPSDELDARRAPDKRVFGEDRPLLHLEGRG